MAYLEDARSRSTSAPITNKRSHQRIPQLALEQWLPLLIGAGLLAGWEIAVVYGWLSALFFPAPSVIVWTLGEQIANGTLASALQATLTRLVGGTVLGGTVGLLFGLIMGWSARWRAVVDPLIAASHPIPKIALLPLALIIFGIGETATIVLIALSAFYPMLINTMAGVQQIAPIHFEVARNYGASRGKLLRRVIVPGSLPFILTGMRLALNTALVITLSVELLTSQSGLGATIWLAWQTMRLRQLYATLIVIALLGAGFNLLITKVAARLAPWQLRHIH